MNLFFWKQVLQEHALRVEIREELNKPETNNEGEMVGEVDWRWPMAE